MEENLQPQYFTLETVPSRRLYTFDRFVRTILVQLFLPTNKISPGASILGRGENACMIDGDLPICMRSSLKVPGKDERVFSKALFCSSLQLSWHSN